MSKRIAIFGAGWGLGASVARRWAKEGYQPLLITRRAEAAAELMAQLKDEGIEAKGLAADLSDPAGAPDLVARVKREFGPIDVLYYGPITTDPFVAAADLTAPALQAKANLHLFTPVALIHAALPDLLARGEGAILVTAGASAVHAMPFLSGLGPPMAAVRNYLHSLHGELLGKGIYVGGLYIGALIAGSANQKALAGLPNPPPIPTIQPADLADTLWSMYTKRDRREALAPEGWSPVNPPLPPAP